MKLYSNIKLMRLTAWILTLTTTTLMAPLDVWAAKQDEAPKLRQHMQEKKVKHQPDVRELTDMEMSRMMGSGPYRNAYLCGTAPWHRSFRDVNLCTGNLFKSFTDIQVAPARGAGLVLQRTYNSNDDRVDGPFGHGWTHAYDIRMEEASQIDNDLGLDKDGNPISQMDRAVRTDFFGGKHVYKRDADGLYTPPPYMHDFMASDYKAVLAAGPGDINSDIEIGLDGTEKHFVKIGDARVCDYMKDRNGNRTNLVYDANGHLYTVTDPSDRVLHFTWTNYSGHWRITQVTGPLQTVNYSYYQPGETGCGGEGYNLKSVTLDPSGLNRTTTYTYTNDVGWQASSEFGLLASITDPRGNRLNYTYNYNNDYLPGSTVVGVFSVTEPAGVKLVAGQFPQSQKHEWWCYTNGWYQGSCIAGVMDMGDSTWNDQTHDWDWDNGIYYMVGAISFDQYKRVIHIDNCPWHMQLSEPATWYRYTYDVSNNIIAKIHHAAVWQDYQYEETIDSDNYIYGRFGNVRYHYNGDYDQNAIVSPPTDRPYDEYTYYGESKYFQKASSRDMNGYVTTFDYDNHACLSLVRDARHQPSGTTFTYQYNEYGQKVSETNLNGVSTTYVYGDNWGNLTQVIQDPGVGHLNLTTSIVYDEAGRATSRTDPMGRTVTMIYNNLGQPVVGSFPATYNDQGNEITPAETVEYNYGINGRLESVSDNRGQTTLTYEDEVYRDSNNNLLTNIGDRVASITDPVTGTISNTYTRLGSIAKATMPNGKSFTYTYMEAIYPGSSTNPGPVLSSDDLNDFHEGLIQISDNEGNRVNYVDNMAGGFIYVDFNQSFDSNGVRTKYCRTRYYPYGLKTDNVYTTQHWLGQIKNTFNYKDTSGVWHSTLLSQNDYTYDNVGNRLTNTVTDQNDIPRTETYGYDELNRLSTVNYGDGASQTYAFDDMGNRTSLNGENYTYNAANMLLTKGTQPYTNDANGNQLTGGGRTNTWDSQNRLISCTYGSNTSTFIYGSDGLRRSMTVNGTTTHYALVGQNVAQEGHLNQNNEFVADVSYLTGPRGTECRIDEATGQTRWYLFDGLGSVVGEVDEDGNITATSKYDVYGAVKGSSGTSDSQHKFCGKLGHTQEDDTGGLIYMRARWMDPVTGRFISEDPKHDGINWYTYCGNNPINFADASGKAGNPLTNLIWDQVKDRLKDMGAEYLLVILEKQNPYTAQTIRTILAGVAAASGGLALAGEASELAECESPAGALTAAAGTIVVAGALSCATLNAVYQIVLLTMLCTDPTAYEGSPKSLF